MGRRRADAPCASASPSLEPATSRPGSQPRPLTRRECHQLPRLLILAEPNALLLGVTSDAPTRGLQLFPRLAQALAGEAGGEGRGRGMGREVVASQVGQRPKARQRGWRGAGRFQSPARRRRLPPSLLGSTAPSPAATHSPAPQGTPGTTARHAPAPPGAAAARQLRARQRRPGAKRVVCPCCRR
jgi:hypothetical protein